MEKEKLKLIANKALQAKKNSENNTVNNSDKSTEQEIVKETVKKTPPTTPKIKLAEGVAYRNLGKEGADRVPVYIKQAHLDYEKELQLLQL